MSKKHNSIPMNTGFSYKEITLVKVFTLTNGIMNPLIIQSINSCIISVFFKLSEGHDLPFFEEFNHLASEILIPRVNSLNEMISNRVNVEIFDNDSRKTSRFWVDPKSCRGTTFLTKHFRNRLKLLDSTLNSKRLLSISGFEFEILGSGQKCSKIAL